MTAFSDYLENQILDTLIRGVDTYMALFFSPTGDDGTGTEASGGGYARQSITFDAATAGTIISNNEITFSAMDGTTITHAAIYDAPTGGNMLVHGELSSSISPTPGADVVLASGEVSITAA